LWCILESSDRRRDEMTAYIFRTHKIATWFFQKARQAGYSVRILGNVVIGDSDAGDILNHPAILIEYTPEYTAVIT